MDKDDPVLKQVLLDVKYLKDDASRLVTELGELINEKLLKQPQGFSSETPQADQRLPIAARLNLLRYTKKFEKFRVQTQDIISSLTVAQISINTLQLSALKK